MDRLAILRGAIANAYNDNDLDLAFQLEETYTDLLDEQRQVNHYILQTNRQAILT